MDAINAEFSSCKETPQQHLVKCPDKLHDFFMRVRDVGLPLSKLFQFVSFVLPVQASNVFTEIILLLTNSKW